MQRVRWFFAALALCHWNDTKRIGHVQMQITPMKRIDFTATQTHQAQAVLPWHKLSRSTGEREIQNTLKTRVKVTA